MGYTSILHIDDDEDDQEIFLTALRKISEGINYTAIDNAVDALQNLNDNVVTPDIIFLDLNMPEMNGQQFLMELNKNTRLHQIPVIVLSTSAHLPTMRILKEMGAHDFITKPDKFEELRDKLYQILL